MIQEEKEKRDALKDDSADHEMEGEDTSSPPALSWNILC